MKDSINVILRAQSDVIAYFSYLLTRNMNVSFYVVRLICLGGEKICVTLKTNYCTLKFVFNIIQDV